MKRVIEISFAINFSNSTTDKRKAAVYALGIAATKIAEKLEVCPTCLTYSLANNVMEAELSGNLKHDHMMSDDIEDMETMGTA